MTRMLTDTNSEKDLVARLSPNAAKALLTLLLSQGSQDAQPLWPEFAIHLGLSGWSTSEVLFELEQLGLTEIIALPHKFVVVCKIHICTQESGQTIHANETPPQEMGTSPGTRKPDRDVLPAPIKEGPGETEAGGRIGTPPTGLIDQCHLADESGKKQAQVKALRAVWDDVFPENEYPFQRLTEDGARRLLAGGRTAEGVGSLIVEAVGSATRRIESPRAFVEAVLKNRDRKQPDKEDEQGVVITDGLRRLAELGRKQYGTTHQA